METEPTTLMTILDILLQIVVYFIVMGGVIFGLFLLSKFPTKYKHSENVKRLLKY